MPLIEVTLAEGRSPEQIRTMMHEVHEAVLRTVNTRPGHIRVIVRQVPRAHWATGDVTLLEMDAASAPPRTDAPDTPSRTEEQS
jgi:4-oxalocrotonate tautomerase